MNLLITQLENEKNPENKALICFYKKEQKKLIKLINHRIKKELQTI